MIQGHGDDTYKYDKVSVNFSSNIYNHFDHAGLFAHLAGKLPCITNYPEPTPGRLERKLAGHMGVGAANVMVTNGATEAIYLIAQAFQGRHSHILQPTFAEYADACTIHHHDVHSITSLDSLFRDSQEETSGLVWLCNPNNPTGSVISHEDITHTINRHNGIIFVIDQSYAHYTALRLLTIQEAVQRNNTLIIRSMTKDYAIPGLRLGYVVGPTDIIENLRRIRMPWSVNQLAIEAGLYLLNHTHDYVINAAALCEERQRMEKEFQQMNIKVAHSDSNMLLCLLPKSDAATLKKYLATTHGILIRDASNFRLLSTRHFRIAIQTPQENDLLINALHQWIH